jgi:hypothetical protein
VNNAEKYRLYGGINPRCRRIQYFVKRINSFVSVNKMRTTSVLPSCARVRACVHLRVVACINELMDGTFGVGSSSSSSSSCRSSRIASVSAEPSYILRPIAECWCRVNDIFTFYYDTLAVKHHSAIDRQSIVTRNYSDLWRVVCEKLIA